MSRHSQLNRVVAAVSFGIAALASSAAHADHYPAPEVVQGPSITLSRSEVLKDLKAYQSSGLAAAERLSLEQGHDVEGLEPARARYAQLTQRPYTTKAPLFRSEVLAELRIYQESGLALADREYLEQGVETEALRTARSRYVMLREGERYAMLVAQFAQRTGEPRQANGG